MTIIDVVSKHYDALNSAYSCKLVLSTSFFFIFQYSSNFRSDCLRLVRSKT